MFFFSKIAFLKKCEYQGDGYCDDSNNHAGCDFDGGDCCLIPIINGYCSECSCYGGLFVFWKKLKTPKRHFKII